MQQQQGNINTKHASIKNHVRFSCSGILLLIKFEESTVLITDMYVLEFIDGRLRQVSRTEENGVIICIPQVCTGYFRIAKAVTFSLNVHNHPFLPDFRRPVMDKGLCFQSDFTSTTVDVSCIVNILGEWGGAIQKRFHSDLLSV